MVPPPRDEEAERRRELDRLRGLLPKLEEVDLAKLKAVKNILSDTEQQDLRKLHDLIPELERVVEDRKHMKWALRVGRLWIGWGGGTIGVLFAAREYLFKIIKALFS